MTEDKEKRRNNSPALVPCFVHGTHRKSMIAWVVEAPSSNWPLWNPHFDFRGRLWSGASRQRVCACCMRRSIIMHVSYCGRLRVCFEFFAKRCGTFGIPFLLWKSPMMTITCSNEPLKLPI